MTSPIEVAKEQMGSEVKVEEAGLEEKTVDTATTTEEPVTDETGLQPKKEEGVSFEEIMGEEKPLTEEQKKVAEVRKGKEGTPPWLQKRLDDMTREKELLKKENIRLKTEAVAPKEHPLVPDRDAFDTVADYQKAYLQYENNVRAYNAAHENAEAVTVETEQREKDNANRLIEQAEVLKEKFPDVIDIIQKTVYGDMARESIADSDHSARIALFLAKNPSELSRIASITSQTKLDKEIGKLEARFDNVKTKTTKAPAALNTIDSKTETVVKNTKDIKDNNQWFRARNKEMREKQGSKYRT